MPKFVEIMVGTALGVFDAQCGNRRKILIPRESSLSWFVDKKQARP
jgi:hypothetical protein